MELEKVIVEIETGDIDDSIALIYALMCPHFEVLAVLVCPGSVQQLGLVERLYDYIKLPKEQRPILGSLNFNESSKVSPMYTRTYGPYENYKGERRLGKDIIIENCKKFPNQIVYITLGPPKILSQALLENDYIQVKMWLAQGGFAGVGVVDENKILPKFKGMKESPTWNLGGSVKESEFLMGHSRIGCRFFVSKNVCHDIVYDSSIHEQMKILSKEGTFASYFYDIMEKAYFKHKKDKNLNKGSNRGTCIKKKIHDIIPLMTLFNKDVCKFKQVQLKYNRKNSSWGSTLANDTDTYISVEYDPIIYFKLLINYC